MRYNRERLNYVEWGPGGSNRCADRSRRGVIASLLSERRSDLARLLDDMADWFVKYLERFAEMGNYD